jgi:hypothetical protein
MDLSDVLHVAGAYGPSGIIVAWFAWRDWRRDVRDEKRESARCELEEKRIAADLELAKGYAVLATRLEGLMNVRSM